MKKALFIQNGLNIIYPRQPMIRRESNKIEDILTGKYFQPQVIPVPDEMDAQIPRLIFTSTHGFSQIVISQINAALNAKYSPDWQENISKGRNYLLERIDELVSITKEYEPSYCGLTTIVRIPIERKDKEIIKVLNTGYGKFTMLTNFHDFHIKYTTHTKGKYFNNMTIKNFRLWDQMQEGPGLLSTKSAFNRGIEIKNDFNNRYAYNEQTGFVFDVKEIKIIIEKGFDSIQKEIQKIKGLL